MVIFLDKDVPESELCCTKVLHEVLQEIERRSESFKRLTLKEPAFSEVGDDCGSTGYMRYDEISVITAKNGKTWALAVGKKDKSYVGRGMLSDLIAIDLGRERFEREQKNIFKVQASHTSSIKKSIFIAMESGEIVAQSYSIFYDYARGSLYFMDSSLILKNRQSPGQKGVTVTKYRPEAAKYLAIDVMRLIFGYIPC